MKYRVFLVISLALAGAISALIFLQQLDYSDDLSSSEGLSPYKFTSASNCAKYSDCETYCSDPSHYSECSRFFSQRSSDASPHSDSDVTFVNHTVG